MIDLTFEQPRGREGGVEKEEGDSVGHFMRPCNIDQSNTARQRIQ